MGRRSHKRSLNLWMNGAFVGTWHLSPNAPDTLQYDTAWTRSQHGRALSLSLPFTPGNAPHRGPEVRTYFENLLPDSKDIRERIARRYRTGTTDAFDLLAEIGRDCVGALEILPDGEASAGIAPLQAEPLSESQVAQILRGTTATHILGMVGSDDDGTALPAIAASSGFPRRTCARPPARIPMPNTKPTAARAWTASWICWQAR